MPAGVAKCFCAAFEARACEPVTMSTGAGAATGSGGVAGAGAHGVVDVTSEAQFKSLSSAAPGLVCVFFWEDFHEASRRGGQMDMVVTQLAKAHPDVSFLKVRQCVVPLSPLDTFPTQLVVTVDGGRRCSCSCRCKLRLCQRCLTSLTSRLCPHSSSCRYVDVGHVDAGLATTRGDAGIV